jgi:hypothetical protein
MRRVAFGGWLAVLISGTSISSVAQAPTPQADAPHPVVLNLPFTSAMTWFDGVYAGRSGITEFPAGWNRTLARGLGGACAISVNASRPVVDVISELRRQYGGSPPVN